MSRIIGMVMNSPIGRHIMKILCRSGKFKDTEKVIRYHLFGIGIGTDIVFGISVPEVPPVVLRYSQLCKSLWCSVALPADKQRLAFAGKTRPATAAPRNPRNLLPLSASSKQIAGADYPD